MKAIVVTDEAAGTAGMTLVERPEPEPATNDVVVQVHGSGFTSGELTWPSTWTDRLGRARTPSIPGQELAGVVTALGYGTTGLSVGQRVFGLTDSYRGGGLAEYVAIEARNLAPLPGDVDFTVGASLPMPGLTAWQGLFDHGRLQAGQNILVHGAAGAVGSMVTQLAREAGAYVIGTGRAADRQKTLDFGAMEFVDLENDALEDVGGVDLVFDVIGGDIQQRSAGVIRAGGTLVTIAGPPEARPVDGLAIDFVVLPDRAQLGEIVPAGAGRTAADEHRQHRDPRRCRRGLQSDRADQRADDHPRSSVSDTRPSMLERRLRTTLSAVNEDVAGTLSYRVIAGKKVSLSGGPWLVSRGADSSSLIGTDVVLQPSGATELWCARSQPPWLSPLGYAATLLPASGASRSAPCSGAVRSGDGPGDTRAVALLST